MPDKESIKPLTGVTLNNILHISIIDRLQLHKKLQFSQQNPQGNELYACICTTDKK